MNLAIVSPFPPAITGIGQYGYHISRILAQSGQFDRVTVLAGAHPGSPHASTPETLQIRYAWRPGALSAGPAIALALRQIRPDLVWYNLGASVFGRSPAANLIGFLSMAHARAAGLPTVVTLHELVELADLKTLRAPGGPLAQLGAHLLTFLATRADVVCLTLRRYVEHVAARCRRLRCFHIPIGAYGPPEALPEPPGPELLFFTTLAPYKGLEILLAAYRRLAPLYPRLRLTIAGVEHPRFPGYAGRLRRECAALPGIRWLGQAPEDHIRPMFAQAQIVVLPYQASTGSSSVIYQAARWGRALIASDLPDTTALAAENGLDIEFFKNGDPASLAAAIQTLLGAPERRRRMAQANLTAIARNRPEDTCRLYLQAFNLALETRQSAKRLNAHASFTPESV